MKNSLIGKIFMVAIFLSSACTSSKLDFKTAYKFSHYNYQKHHPEVSPQVVQPLASLKPIMTPREHLPSDQGLISISPTPTSATQAFMEKYQNASKKERKEIRKDFRQKLKEVRQEIKMVKEAPDQQAKDVVFNQKMYIGLIVFLAGIVVAILASGAVGALAIIVGVALIAWGFIEQA